MSRRGWILFIGLCIAWGVPYMFTRIAVREVTPQTLVFLRTLPAAILLAPIALRRGELRGLLRHWRWLAIYTAVEIAVPYFLLAHAQQRVTSSLTGLLVASVPLIAAVVYSRGSAHERYDWRRTTGLVIGFVGVAALIGLDIGAEDAAAVVEVFGAAFCFATGPFVVSRRLAGLPSLGVTVVSLILNSIVYAPTLVIWPPWPLSAPTIASVAVLSLVSTALALLLYFNLVREVGPSRTTIVTYVNPLVAVLLGVAVLGEPFTAGLAVGMPLVLIGSALATARSRGPRAPVPAP
jgi:drug/metabolite transporter (DMT)-like permease